MNGDVPKPPAAQPVVCVEDSRAKRIQRQQARIRDRGGIFIPTNRNMLADILLARGVNGESPSKAQASQRGRKRSPSSSPVRQTKRTATARGNSKGRKSVEKGDLDCALNEAGPSQLKSSTRNAGKGVASTVVLVEHKGKSKAKVFPEDVVETPMKPAPKKRGRPPKIKVGDGSTGVSSGKPPKAKPSAKSHKASDVSENDEAGDPYQVAGKSKASSRGKSKLERIPSEPPLDSDCEMLPKPTTKVRRNVKSNPERSKPQAKYRQVASEDEPELDDAPNKVQQKSRKKTQSRAEVPVDDPAKENPRKKRRVMDRDDHASASEYDEPKEPSKAPRLTLKRNKKIHGIPEPVVEFDKKLPPTKNRSRAVLEELYPDAPGVEADTEEAAKRQPPHQLQKPKDPPKDEVKRKPASRPNSRATAASTAKSSVPTLKENALYKKPASTTQRKKPRKSVMARIRKAAEEVIEVDDEPDPIDFLS